MQPDLAGDEIHLLVVVFLEIDDAVGAEARDDRAGLRVQRDQPVARRDVQDPRIVSRGRRARPVRQPAARQLSRRGGAARAFVLAVHPPHLAGRGVERHHRTARAGGRVDGALDHQRRGLELELGPRTETIGLEPPRDVEGAEVGGVDLGERRVSGMPQIAAVATPLAVGGAGLTDDRGRRAADEGRDAKPLEQAHDYFPV